MVLTEKDLTQMCEELCSKVGYDFHIPIVINKRLKTTLGRVSYIRSGGRVKSIKMEFSHQFLSTSTLECIQDVVAHETAHYLCNEMTGEAHHHDKVFKEMCAKLGTTNDSTKTRVDRTVGIDEDSLYKYVITCKDCGTKYYRHRSCNLIKYSNAYKCSCGGSLIVTQNW